MSTKLRVALLIPTLILKGGTQFQMLKLYEQLVKNHTLKIFTFYYHEQKTFKEYQDAAVVSFIPKNLLPDRFVADTFLLPLSILLFWAQFFSLIKYKPSVINAHDWFSSWQGAVYKWLFNHQAKVIVMLNDMPPFFYETTSIRMKFFGTIDELLCRHVSTYLVLDNRMKQKASQLYPGKVSVIRSGLELEAYQKIKPARSETRKKFSLPEDQFLFFCASVPSPHRKFEDAILALSLLSDFNTSLVIIGDFSLNREYFSQLQQLIKDKNISDRVFFINRFLDSDERMHLLKDLDCLIFPNKNQTWGLTVIEVMAVGTPVIVSNDCGVSEVITHGLNGLIFKQGSFQELSTQMSRVINNKSHREKLSKIGMQFVHTHFSWKKYAENMVKYF